MKLRIQNEKILSRQTVSAKIHSQKGNSPDYLLRSLKIIKCEKCKKILTINK